MLSMWGTVALLLLILVFLQSLSGRLYGIQPIAWGWLALAVLPGLSMLFGTTLSERSAYRMVPRFVHRSLLWASALYLVLVLATLLAEPFALQHQLSIKQYRLQSLYWLLPFQSLLLAGFYLLFYRRKAFYHPPLSSLQEVAKGEAGRSALAGQERRRHCLELISKGQLEQALEQWREWVGQSGIGDLEQAVSLQSQYHEHQKNHQMNLISYEEWQRGRSRVAAALLALLRQ